MVTELHKIDKRLSESNINLTLSHIVEELCVFCISVLFQHNVLFDVVLSSFPFGCIYQRSGSIKVSLLVNPEYFSWQ